MKRIIVTATVLFIALLILVYFIFFHTGNQNWILDDIQFKARDGFVLDAYLLRPAVPRRKYPAVACFHQLWGNRDDFLKLFPKLAEAGIVVLAPNFPRQQPTYDPKRISDLRNALDFLESIDYVDGQKLGMVTASFSVETGMTAINQKPNVIASVMISGQILRENSRKGLTHNSNLAIFNIASVHDGSHYLIMKECLARSLNPFSRSFFIEKQEDPFSIQAHGTFVFDEIPDSLDRIQQFFMDVFGIFLKNEKLIDKEVLKNTVYLSSTDGLPVVATLKLPESPHHPVPAVILYPPQFKSRMYYDKLADRLAENGIAVLAPNTKRTCREPVKIHLCDKEIHGALQYILKDGRFDPSRIALVFPSFYFLIARKMIENREIPVKMVVMMEAGPNNYGINPRKMDHAGYCFHYLKKPSLGQLKYILLNSL